MSLCDSEFTSRYILNPDILQKIISKQLLKYSIRSYETDFDKFISNGINTFIRNNDDIRENLNEFIEENMLHINSINILTSIILNRDLHNYHTKHLIKSFIYFTRKTLINVLFGFPSYLKLLRNRSYLYNSKSLTKFQNILMYTNGSEHNEDYIINLYLELPKDIIIESVKSMLKYLRNTIDSLRISGFHSYVVGHFIESILTETKYYSTCDSLKRCMCVDKQSKKWLYTEEDFVYYTKRIEHLITKINWGNFKGNCYLYSTFPYVYIDYVVKSNKTEDDLLIYFNELIKLISTKIPNFKLFQNSLKGYISAVLLISSETTNENDIKFKKISKFKKIHFKGSVITNTPLRFENDVITTNDIVEIKTGMTDTKKNMCKLILENIILSRNNGKFKNLIIFNPRSTTISFISSNKFK